MKVFSENQPAKYETLFPLNIYSIDNISNWRKEFFWPISQKEIYDVELRCASALLETIRSLDKEQQLFLRILCSLIHSQLNDWCAAMIVAQRLGELALVRRLEISVSSKRKTEDVRMLSSDSVYELLQGREPLEHYVGNALKNPLRNSGQEDYVASVKRFLGRLIRQSGDCKKAILWPAQNLAVNANSNTKKYLIREGSIFAHLNVSSFLAPFQDSGCAGSALRDISEKVVSILESIYIHYTNESVGIRLYDYFADVISKFLKIVEFDLNTVRKRKNKLADKHLFTGTGGNYFTRIVSLVARENGAYVTGFPHGGGSQCIYFPKFAFTEFETPDEFICYDSAEVEECKKYPTNNEISFREVKGIEPSILNVEASRNGNRLDLSRIKKIMYVSSGFFNDRQGSQVIPETVLFEFELYLLEYLLGLGKKVVYKNYPKALYLSKTFDLFGYFEDTEIEFERRWFSDPDVLKDIDLLIFAKASSTALYEAMTQTDIPIVLLHLNIPRLTDVFVKQVHKRGFLIKLYQDGRNRIRFRSEDFETIFA